MPKIPDRLKESEWQPQLGWPDDCYVQWGGRGLVFSRKGSRITAFFEAFPDGGGFIRGEGETLEQAEANAFREHGRTQDCVRSGGHYWSRTRRLKGGRHREYTNGAGFCSRCGAFGARAFRPVLRLGNHKGPLSALEVDLLMDGDSAVEPSDDRETARYKRAAYLRGRLAGIDLPDWGKWVSGRAAYRLACEKAVVRWYADLVANGGRLSSGGGGLMTKLFEGAGLAAVEERTREYGFMPPKSGNDQELPRGT